MMIGRAVGKRCGKEGGGVACAPAWVILLCGGLAAGCASSARGAQQRGTHEARRSHTEHIAAGDRWFFCGGVEDLAKAGASYDRAIAVAPDRVPARVFARRAEVFRRTGQLAEGLAFVDDVALDKFPDNVPILEQKIRLLRALGKRLAAKQIVDRLQARAAAGGVASQAARRHVYVYSGRRARRLEQGVLTGLERGVEKLRRGDHASAMREFRAVRERLDAARATRDPGATLDAPTEDTQAIQRCREALGLRSHRGFRVAGWLNLARYYLSIGDARRARKAALEITRRRPNDVRGWELIGDIYAAEGNHRRALEYYLRAMVRTGEAESPRLLDKIEETREALAVPAP